MIHMKNVSKVYSNGTEALKNVTLNIERGEFVFIVGSSGAGKSTFLKLLIHEETATFGKIKVNGFDLMKIKKHKVPYLRRTMGIVFQDFQLLADRSVYKNLEFVLKATGWKKRDGIEERIEEVLKAVGMEDKASQMPFELSGGEQQRVAIARAILNKPKLILADEPTGNLDPETSDEIIKLLFRFADEGTAVVMVTHNLPLIKEHPSITYRCQDAQMEDVTNDFHHLVIVDDTPDPDETKVRYSEREEI